MKCYIDNMEIFELNDTQVNILSHLIPRHQLEDVIKGWVHQVVGQKIRECAGKLFEEFKPKMAKEGVEFVPLMDIDLAKMIFERPDYVSQAVTPINSDTPTIPAA